MRTCLGLGIVLLAAGLTLALRATHEARRVPEESGPAAFRTGILVFAPPADRPPDKPAAPSPADAGPAAGGAPSAPPAPASASGDRPPAPARPVLDFESLFGSLTAEDIAAVRQSLDPLGGREFLPLRLLRVVHHEPPHAAPLVVPVAVAVVSDAEADRRLVPLAGRADASVYVGTDAPAAALLGQVRAPGAGLSGDADVEAARLPPSARCFQDVMLVRASAAGRLGLEPKGTAPNVLAVDLARPGRLEEAMQRVWPLWGARRLSARPVDWRLGGGALPRGLGVAALALGLAGGTAVAAAAMAALGRAADFRGAVRRRLFGGAAVLARAPRAYALVLAAMLAALVLGAAWGGPALLADLIRAKADEAEPLAAIGLESAGLGLQNLAGLLVMAFVTNLLLWAVVGIGVPSLVPGLGVAAALAQFFLWGVVLSPVTVTALDRLPLRAVVAVVEGHGYALVALGAWRVLAGVLRPRTLGAETRRQGYAAGLEELYRLLPLAAVWVLAGAVLETGLVAVLSHWR